MLTVATLLICAASPVLAESFNQDTLNGVVYIYWTGFIEQRDDAGNISIVKVGESGTGFFVGLEGENPQYIITNHHVVEDFLNIDNLVKKYAQAFQEQLNMDVTKNAKQNFPLYVFYDQEDYEQAYVVDYDEEKDFAVLKIANPTDKRTPLRLRKSSNKLVGQSVWAVGFPAVADRMADSVTSYGKEDATVTMGSVNRIFTATGTGEMFYQTDAKTRGGNSGGPLVDGNGNALGINTWVAADWVDPNLNYAICIDEVLPMLEKNSVPYTPASELNLSLILIIAGCVVAAGVLVVLIVVLTRKKRPVAVGAGAGAPAVGAPGAGGALPAGAPGGSVPARPVVRSMSPQHGGLTVALTGQPVVIGRDPSTCRIVFRKETPGVSSKHCQLVYDSQNSVFVLTDLNSSYGTFLSSGQKLTPGVPYPLRQRDSFYLGERENTLYVDLG